jgi:hypothetical protein
MFVIDAATLYCRRTRAGQLCALHQLDGATIKRVIDDWGRTPQPYAAPDGSTIYPPAYQQVLKGLPAVDYAVRDIIYRPRNVRAHRVYGYSPVQQVLMTVNIALRRQLWQLDYFSEGSIPDALIGVPAGWTPDQIRQFQDYWDTEFAGEPIPLSSLGSFLSTSRSLFRKERKSLSPVCLKLRYSVSPTQGCSTPNAYSPWMAS